MDSGMKFSLGIPEEKEDLSLVTELSDDEKIDLAAVRILEEYREAFLELAK